MNIASLLSRTAETYPLLNAVIDGLEVVSDYRQLQRRVQGIAGYLRTVNGCQVGDRVALVMKNCPQYIEVLLGILHAGLAAVPVNAKLHSKEISYILKDSGASVLFVTEDLLGAFPDEAAETLLVLSVHDDNYAVLCQSQVLPLQAVKPDDLAWLFYTSGTTGQPKGAMISHGNLWAMTRSYFASVDNIDVGDTLLHAAPMSHGSGLYIFPNIAKGAQQVVCKSGGFNEQEIFDYLAYHPRVSFFAAPTMIHRLVTSGITYEPANSNLKSIIYGGGPMYVADIKAAMACFGNKFIQIYGQGETPMTITCLSKQDHLGEDDNSSDDILASVGTAQACVEIQICDDQGKELAFGETGEVRVKGETVMLGYWQNTEATNEAIEHGWLRTGDLGVMDQMGYLTLKDRSKDLIISGGSNIYPREVEEVLMQHPDIAEVSVVGQSDPEWGEIVVAFVVTTRLASGVELSSQECNVWCLDSIARFKRPKTYHFVDQLPKNSAGKVLKRQLREQLLRKQLGQLSIG